jgi:hypothetical protein
MIKRIIPVAFLLTALTAVSFAQSNDANTKQAVTTEEVVKPFSAEEEEASRKRIENFEAKIKANESNEKVDYAGELKRLKQMKARFNERATTKFKDEK